MSTETEAAQKPIIITKSIKDLTSIDSPPHTNVEQTSNSAESDQNASPSKTNPSTGAQSEQERLDARIKKFGVQTENVKKDLRAKRFGSAVSSSGGDQEKSREETLTKRAQRFGTAPNTPTSNANSTQVSKETLEKRAARFGLAEEDKNKASSPTVDDETLQKRKQRFGIVDQDSKKKLRAQRFETSA